MKPKKLTPEVIEKICHGVSLGMPYERACLLGGIDRRTLSRWKEAAPDSPEGSLLAELTSRMEDAHAKGQAALLEQMKSHAKGVRKAEDGSGADLPARGEWKATQWLLESIYKMRPEAKVDVTSGGEAIKYIVTIPRVDRISDSVDED